MFDRILATRRCHFKRVQYGFATTNITLNHIGVLLKTRSGLAVIGDSEGDVIHWENLAHTLHSAIVGVGSEVDLWQLSIIGGEHLSGSGCVAATVCGRPRTSDALATRISRRICLIGMSHREVCVAAVI